MPPIEILQWNRRRMSELNMESNQFQSRNKITCALCEKSDETEVTGPLSSKDKISAHQNCLLFASAIYCKNSPTYDDLFGFDVEDVKTELKRGKRLLCHYCKKSGATAGCDVKRCKRSYHYPCAIKDRARTVENSTKGSYKLFCELHDPDSKKISSENLLGASPCDHRGSKRRTSVDGESPNMKGPDRRDSDSSSGSSEVSSSKKKKMMSPIWLDSDDDECVFATLQSDVEDCKPPILNNTSTSGPQSKSHCAESSPSTTGSLNLTSAQKACGSTDNPGDLNGRSTPAPKKTRLCEKLKPSTTEPDDDTDIDSEESQSLLPLKPPCITIPCRVILDSGPSAESEHSLEASSPVGAAPASASTSPESVLTPEQKKTPTSPSPQAPTTEPVSPGVSSSPGRPAAADASDVDITVKSKSGAALFWTRCNEAGWTKEIFSELVSQLSSLGERVQSPTASQQDYDVAFKVLGASGRLPCIITQLEQDLEKQEQDLKRKKAALRDAKALLDV